MNPIALQLYTVRQTLADDPLATLQRIRSAGYTAVETAPLPPDLPLDVLANHLQSLDLKVVAAHCALPLGPDRDDVLETAARLQCQRVIWHGWPRDREYDSPDGIRRLADIYNRAHAVARENGLRFGLHNHWWEFERAQGRYPYQLLNELLDPDIFWELDVYWVRTAGLDPARVIEELGPRVALLHLKDGPAVRGQPMTALGEGIIDFASILRSVRWPVGWVVELDECETDPLEAASRSYRYLEALSIEVAAGGSYLFPNP